MKYILIIMLTLVTATAQAQFVENSTTVLCFLPSVTAAANTLARHDRRGMLQLGLSSAACIVTNYGLEAAITKDRPNGKGHHAFPSTHTAAAFNGATFLTRRYGWKWGVPAYAIAAYVGWGRVHIEKHDWWDVIGGAVIGSGTALAFARPFVVKDADIALSPIIGDGKYGLAATVRW